MLSSWKASTKGLITKPLVPPLKPDLVPTVGTFNPFGSLISTLVFVRQSAHCGPQFTSFPDTYWSAPRQADLLSPSLFPTCQCCSLWVQRSTLCYCDSILFPGVHNFLLSFENVSQNLPKCSHLLQELRKSHLSLQSCLSEELSLLERPAPLWPAPSKPATDRASALEFPSLPTSAHLLHWFFLGLPFFSISDVSGYSV